MTFRFARTLVPALAVAALALLAACDQPARDADARPRAAAPAPARAERQPPLEGAGEFVVAYGEVEDTVYARWQREFRQNEYLEGMAQWLNGWIALPRNVTLAFAQCGEPNAFYQEDDHAVLLCLELVEELDAIFARDPDQAQAVEDALLFTLLHEVGHALVHVLEIPVTGREEDAVDQLAALILADGTQDGDEAALNGVRGLPDDGQLDELAFADEHALTAQRFYNVVCLLYGQDPDTYASWVEDGTLPPERAERCPVEYERTARSWDTLLAPYLKG
jgi:hypothetical protein